MGKVLWHTPLSLDGFIAGPDDDMGWLFDVDGGSGQSAEEVVKSTGALLVGRRTQDVEDRLQMGFYGGAFRGPFFVLRHDPPAQPPVVKGVTGQFLDMGIEQAVRLSRRPPKVRTSSSWAPMSPASVWRPGLWTRSSCISLRSSSAGVFASMRAPVALRSGSRRSLPTWRARPRYFASRSIRRQANDCETREFVGVSAISTLFTSAQSATRRHAFVVASRRCRLSCAARVRDRYERLERETRLELATSSLEATRWYMSSVAWESSLGSSDSGSCEPRSSNLRTG